MNVVESLAAASVVANEQKIAQAGYIRQGDMYLYPYPGEVANTRKRWAHGPRRLVPRGGRGSNHTVAKEDAARCRVVLKPKADPNEGDTFLLIVEGPHLAQVIHPEHPAVLVEPGAWMILPQKSLTGMLPDSAANVARRWRD